ncbi:MAG: DUF4974 domain-containing protein, partial [Bacteroidetes bacterium]|nr:DUF4974 domain-containing protein [Bacteroidota bacterium]
GTKVWLNAASSIRYPAVFSGSDRRVFVSGEAYFEVAAGKTPFIAEVKQAGGKKEEVNVLGTRFNINAYDDEPSIATTLLEGKVMVQHDAQKTMLSPGQQSLLTADREVRVVMRADLEQVMAWKNGIFRFDNVDLKKVLRQLSRWYDVEVEYAPGAPVDELYNGEMQRSLRLSQVLKGLDGMGVHFKMEGRRFILLP